MFLSPEVVNIQEAEAGESLWALGACPWVTCTQGHGHFLRGHLCPRCACWWKVLGLAPSIPILPSPSDWGALAPSRPLRSLPAPSDPASGQTQVPPGASLQKEGWPGAHGIHSLIHSFMDSPRSSKSHHVAKSYPSHSSHSSSLYHETSCLSPQPWAWHAVCVGRTKCPPPGRL